jgi:glycosyltransferase involved in cell wall biosynthesis
VKESTHTRRIIAIVHEHYQPLATKNWGGFGVYPEYLLKSLHSINDNEISRMLEIGKEILHESNVRLNLNNFQRLCLKLFPKYYEYRFSRIFTKINPNFETIIYHQLNQFVLPPTWLIKISKQYNIKLMTTIIDFQEYKFPQFFSKRIIEKRQRNYAINLKLAKSFVTASPFLAKSAREFFGIDINNIVIAPLGWNHIPTKEILDSVKIQNHVLNNSPYMVFPSKGWAHKGHIELIREFGKHTLSAKLVLVGDLGARESEILGEIEKCPRREDIISLGFVDVDLLYAIIARADGLIFPSVYEGFGLPYIEAAHLRTPVIAFENDSVINLLGTSASYLASSGDYVALLDKATEVLRDPNREQVLDLAEFRIRNLTWKNTAILTSKTYKQLMVSHEIEPT